MPETSTVDAEEPATFATAVLEYAGRYELAYHNWRLIDMRSKLNANWAVTRPSPASEMNGSWS
ncbi:hypothetical protein HNV11_21420 [Spirosoma taeanense]|uniref:Uncharacterized protein n=1 Tax=Spirosoma taeanense TaxID=2735870 RepID=A0A6M5YEM8_9BACT|nr:hypothetical protein [Spirosoma taeanense]QJW91756.1 hypothetical protein HNV11_21420 [Spirosoma taeanense]